MALKHLLFYILNIGHQLLPGLEVLGYRLYLDMASLELAIKIQ